jgi:hypothetical protein
VPSVLGGAGIEVESGSGNRVGEDEQLFPDGVGRGPVPEARAEKKGS